MNCKRCGKFVDNNDDGAYYEADYVFCGECFVILLEALGKILKEME